MHRRPPSVACLFACALLLAVPVVPAAEPGPAVARLSVANPTHLLFVGNSYLYYNDSVHNHVRRMVAAAGLREERALEFKSVTISGGALFDHDLDAYLRDDRLRVGAPFQVVILQGGSALGWSKKRPAAFRETVAGLAAKIRAAGGAPALYMTHAYVAPHPRADPGMTATLARHYTDAGNASGALVIPVGLAFAEAYARRPGVVLHKEFDGSHPSLLGTYLAAATVLAAVYGVSPVGNPYDYYGALAADDAAFLQQVAHDVVTRYLGR